MTIPIPQKKAKTLQFALFAALTALLLWISFKDIEWGALWAGIASARYGWIAAATAISIAAYWVRAQRWRLLIEPLATPPTLPSAYRAVMTGYLANFAFPRLGEAVRCGALARSNALPFNKLVGTVLTERLFDMLCLIALMIAGIAIRIDTFGRFLKNAAGAALAQFHPSAALAAGAGAAVLLLAGVFFLLKYKKTNPAAQKARRFLRGTAEGFTAFARMRRRREFLLWTAAIWACYWSMAWLMLYSIPSWGHLTAADGLVAMLLGSLGIVAPANGGLGAFHAVIKYGIPALFGVTEADALGYAVLSHESQALFIVIFGLAAYVRVFAKK